MSIEMENKVFTSQIMDIAKQVLNERQYNIVVATTIHSVPKTVLAEEYGITSSRVYQIQHLALRKIRKALKVYNDGVSDYSIKEEFIEFMEI